MTNLILPRRNQAVFMALFVLPLLVDRAAAQTNLIFNLSNSWRYQQNTNFDGVNWKAPGYPDTDWPVGQGLLAYETCGCVPEPIRTTLRPMMGKFTFYFRTTFNFAGNTNAVLVVLQQLPG